MKKLVLTVFLLHLIGFFLFAQTKILTYEEAINIAIERNIVIKQQKNLLKSNQADKLQGIGGFLPKINANGGSYRTDGRQWSNEKVLW